MDLELIQDMFEILDVDNDIDGLPKLDLSKILKERSISCVASLKNLAISNIANNINFWMDHLPKNPELSLYVISPFDMLNTRDTLDILKKLVRRKLFQNQYLHLLLHQNLVEIDFSLIPNYKVRDAVMKTVFARCKKLKRLKIVAGSLSKDILHMIPILYPNIDYLYIDIPCCADLLELIPLHCHKIESLHLKLDSKDFVNVAASDSIKFLSLNYNLPLTGINLPLTDINYGGFTTIFTGLNEEYNLVNFMTNLPNVQSLSLINFHKLRFSNAIKNVPNVKFSSVLKLELTIAFITIDDVDCIVSVMENIGDLCISYCQLLDTKVFLCIAKLTQLVCLRTPDLNGKSCTYFDTNVESFLIKRGKSLKVLDFSAMNNVDLTLIGACCPNIKELKLLESGVIVLNWIRRDHVTLNALKRHVVDRLNFSLCETCIFLEKISISDVVFHTQEEIDFDFDMIFRGSSNLKILTLSNILEDETRIKFRHFLSTFKCNALQELDVSVNSKIGLNTFTQILVNFPKLKKLLFTSCDLITAEHRDVQKIIDTYKEADIDIEIGPELPIGYGL